MNKILTPYMIMYPFLIATLYANNGEQIQYPKFKIFSILNYSLLPTGRVMHNENLASFKFNENEAYIKLDY